LQQGLPLVTASLHVNVSCIQGGPKKEATAYRVIVPKTSQRAWIFSSNWNVKHTIILSVGIYYSMHDLICDVLSCCALSYDMGK